MCDFVQIVEARNACGFGGLCAPVFLFSQRRELLLSLLLYVTKRQQH